MPRRIATVILLVGEYDEAIAFFTRKPGFVLVEDTAVGAGKRWTLVAPSGGSNGPALLLAQATTRERQAAVGRQGGGRVFPFLHTDDFWRNHRAMQARGRAIC
jgi:catechol 2,3-dioxygenase-like lactoylglutathione lyase family enzyme